MRVVVVSLQSKGAMGLGAIQVVNSINSFSDKVLFVTTQFIKRKYVDQTVNIEIFNLTKENIFTYVNINTMHRFQKCILDFNPDIVYIYSPHPWNMIIFKKIKKPSVYVFHDPFFRVKPRFFSRNYFFSTIYVNEYNIAIKHSKKIIFTCRKVANRAMKKWNIPPEKVDVIPLPSLRMFDYYDKYKDCPPHYDIIFFGRADKYKGLDVLFKSALYLKNVGKEIKGLIVVQGDLFSVVDASLVKQVSNSFEIINDFLSEEELGKYIAASKMVVAPYISATGSHVPHVAFCYGKPVIATNVGCFPEYIKDERFGVLVEPASVKALADAILKVLTKRYDRVLIRYRYEYFLDTWLKKSMQVLFDLAKQKSDG